MFCPKCEAENRDGAKFCNECGFSLQGAAESVREVPAHDEAEPVASKPHVSAPLDLLPHIDVVGVNVDEHGNPFTDDYGEFGYPEEEGASFREPEEDAPLEQPEDEGFDFTPVDAEDPSDLPDDDSELAAADLDADSDATHRIAPVAAADGISDASLTAPLNPWGSGGTMEMPRVPEAAEPARKEFRAPDDSKPKRPAGKIVAVVLALLIVAAGAAAAVTYHLEMWGGKQVPEVVGMTQADATYVLEGKGFTVRAMEIKSDDTEGLVLLSDPASNMRAAEGSEVVIHVAVSRTIPDVVGMTQNDALALLAEEGYENVTVTTEKSNEEEGTVLAVSPESGEKAKAAAPVTVTVAQPYTVPNVSGQDAAAAQAALEAEGYEVSYATVYTEDAAEGSVVSTDPAAGTKLNSGSTVTMYVAKSRASELLDATRNYLVPDSTVKVNGTSYLVKSLDYVEYVGNDAVAFTLTGQPFTSFLGETVYLSARQVSGTITWDDSNNVVSIQ